MKVKLGPETNPLLATPLYIYNICNKLQLRVIIQMTCIVHYLLFFLVCVHGRNAKAYGTIRLQIDGRNFV